MGDLRRPQGTDSIPAIPGSATEAFALVEASALGDRMRRALRRVATGTPIREAAEAEGYASHADVYRAAKRFGLLEIQTEQLMGKQRRVVALGLDELERRLGETPDDVSTRDLVVSNGVGLDKLAKFERWGQEHGARDIVTVLEKLAERLADQEVTLTLGFSLRGSATTPDEIDVTPEPSRGS